MKILQNQYMVKKTLDSTSYWSVISNSKFNPYLMISNMFFGSNLKCEKYILWKYLCIVARLDHNLRRSPAHLSNGGDWYEISSIQVYFHFTRKNTLKRPRAHLPYSLNNVIEYSRKVLESFKDHLLILNNSLQHFVLKTSGPFHGSQCYPSINRNSSE